MSPASGDPARWEVLGHRGRDQQEVVRLYVAAGIILEAMVTNGRSDEKRELAVQLNSGSTLFLLVLPRDGM